MATAQERDDPADGDVVDHRARMRDRLPEVVRDVRRSLDAAGIDLDVIVMIPSSGDAIATFGTLADPSDDEWRLATGIVSTIVRQTVGLDCMRCRDVTCASTFEPTPSAL